VKLVWLETGFSREKVEISFHVSELGEAILSSLISFLCEHNLLKRGCIFLHQAEAIWRGPHPVTLISMPPQSGGRIRTVVHFIPQIILSMTLVGRFLHRAQR
jgi:hypothetical protein